MLLLGNFRCAAVALATGPVTSRRRWQRRWSAWLGVVVLVVALLHAVPALASSPQAVSAVTLSSTAAGATGVTYQFSFTTSGTGALASGQGTITVAAPTGTLLPSCFTGTDTTTHLSIGRCTGSNPAATEVYPVGSAVNAGDQLSIQLDGSTN
ncbi:MAG: hypothetical protein ACYDHH_13370, partial [Solirubrobacteraceae bacterium]